MDTAGSTTEGKEINDADKGAESQEATGGQAEEEVSVVLDGEPGSQPGGNNNLGIRKRINRLRGKLETAASEKSGLEKENETLKQELQLWRMSQGKEKTEKEKGAPNPDDYDNGVLDPKYIKANEDHLTEVISARLKKESSDATSLTQAGRDAEERHVAHYKRADSMGVKDYDATEDAAIKILGKDSALGIIEGGLSNSEALLYYLGKNPKEAQRLADLVKLSPIQATMEVGAIASRLKVKRGKSQVQTKTDWEDPLKEVISSENKGGYDDQFDYLVQRAKFT